MIETFFNILRKTVTAAIVVIFAFVIVYTPQDFSGKPTVPEAEALIGGIVSDPAHTTVSSIGYALQAGLVTKETILDGIAWVIAKNIMAGMVTDLVDWINTGFDGMDKQPAFIKDLDKYLSDIADDAAKEFFSDLGSEDSFLCAPDKIDIQIAVQEKYDQIVSSGQPYQPEGCELEGVFEDYEAFMNGDFESGGWADWLKVTSQPGQYTPYGQQMTAEKAMWNKILNTTDKAKTEADWGDGFKNSKKCTKESLSDGRTKEKCEVVTPNTLINDAIKSKLKAGQESLTAADEISEVLGSLITQLANQAITGAAGILALSPGTGYTDESYAGGSYTAAAASEGTGAGTTAQGLTLLKDSLKIQQDYKALADSSIPSLQAYINNFRNDAAKRQAAQVYLREAQAVQATAPGYITKLQGLVTSYQTLQTEYDNPNTSAARKSAIRQEQMTIMNSFSTLGAYNKSQLESSRTSWNVSNL